MLIKNKKFLVILLGVIVTFSIAISTLATDNIINNEDINGIDENLEHRTVTVEDYKAAINSFESQNLTFDNPGHRKQAKRKFLQELLYDSERIMSIESKGKSDAAKELAQVAKESRDKAKEIDRFEKNWLKLAKKEYGIKVSKKEVDDWIEEHPNNSTEEEHLDYAEAMGMTLEELNLEYDRDLYTKWVVWDKLAPKIAEKYEVSPEDYEDITFNENTPPEDMNYNNQLLYLYEQEVLDYVK